MKVDKINPLKHEKIVSTMNYTKLIFSFKKRRHNLLIFRNFTILLTGMILLSTTGALAQKGNVSVNINNGTVKTFIKEIETQSQINEIISTATG